jgi:PKHD-type hydroxylase
MIGGRLNPRVEVAVLITIPELLNQAQLVKIKEIVAAARFVDGKLSAGMAAERVKENEELEQEPQLQQRLNRILMASVGHNARFRSFALPNRMADFIVARYQPGMHYGDHVDDPIMGSSGPRFRSDISMTIFLNPPEDYEGGELVIRTSFGERQVKLPAGDAVIYPSSSLHQVAEVTGGERLVALTWIQSYVRDPEKRELLFELNQARETLLKEAPAADHSALVDRSYSNLVRMWSDL